MTSLTRWTATGSLRGGCVALLALTLAACGGRASSGAPEAQSGDAGAPPQDAATDAPGLSCTYPKGDCNDDPSDGCETDLTANRTNCGACGHDCGCGDCASGKCVPRTLAEVPWPIDLRVDGDSVFVATGWDWTSTPEERVYKVPKAGGAPSMLFSPFDWGLGDIQRIAVDDSYVFATICLFDKGGCWGNDGVVARVPKAGGKPTVLASWPAVEGPSLVAVDGGYLYWYSFMKSTVVRLPKTGGNAETLTTGLDTCDLASDHLSLYLTQGSFVDPPESCSIVRLSKQDGSREVLAGGLYLPLSIAVNSTSVFWTSADNTVNWAPKEGGVPEVLDSPTAGYALPDGCAPGTIAADDVAVYWIARQADTSGKTEVVKTDLASKTARVLVSGQDSAALLAVDDACVYWTVGAAEQPGAVRAIAKE